MTDYLISSANGRALSLCFLSFACWLIVHRRFADNLAEEKSIILQKRSAILSLLSLCGFGALSWAVYCQGPATSWSIEPSSLLLWIPAPLLAAGLLRCFIKEAKGRLSVGWLSTGTAILLIAFSLGLFRESLPEMWAFEEMRPLLPRLGWYLHLGLHGVGFWLYLATLFVAVGRLAFGKMIGAREFLIWGFMLLALCSLNVAVFLALAIVILALAGLFDSSDEAEHTTWKINTASGSAALWLIGAIISFGILQNEFWQLSSYLGADISQLRRVIFPPLTSLFFWLFAILFSAAGLGTFTSLRAPEVAQRPLLSFTLRILAAYCFLHFLLPLNAAAAWRSTPSIAGILIACMLAVALFYRRYSQASLGLMMMRGMAFLGAISVTRTGLYTAELLLIVAAIVELPLSFWKRETEMDSVYLLSSEQAKDEAELTPAFGMVYLPLLALIGALQCFHLAIATVFGTFAIPTACTAALLLAFVLFSYQRNSSAKKGAISPLRAVLIPWMIILIIAPIAMKPVEGGLANVIEQWVGARRNALAFQGAMPRLLPKRGGDYWRAEPQAPVQPSAVQP